MTFARVIFETRRVHAATHVARRACARRIRRLPVTRVPGQIPIPNHVRVTHSAI